MKRRLKAWGNTKLVKIACCFVFNDKEELLLLQRHIEDLGGGQWGTPGGKIEDGEEAQAAVLREVFEETGLQPGEVTELGTHEVRMPHGAVHMTSFRARVPANSVVSIRSDEHHTYAWFPLQGLLDEANILWGMPTILRDFALLPYFDTDPTLADGSEAILLELANSD